MNTPLGIYFGNSFVPSRYVVTSLFTSITNQTIAILREVLIDNPLLQG